MRGTGPILRAPTEAIYLARGRLFPFVPVFLGIGIGLWFLSPAEPGAAAYAACAALAVLAAATALFGRDAARAPAIALFCLALGGPLAGLRSHLVAAPVLSESYRGPVLGRVVELDRSSSDALRITLDQVWLQGLAPESTPARVRISLIGQEPDLEPGSLIQLTAQLSAPPAPAEPGAMDMRRLAWFRGLGALGYTRSPPVLWQAARGSDQFIGRWRMSLSTAIRQAIPGDAGAFASGAMTGDRSGIRKATVEDLRGSNLAHLLAISGMNLAFVAGFVILLVRGGLALCPPVALRLPAKKIAVLIALPVSAGYLALSGGNIATTRAFLMLCLMMGAVLLDRRAISLRAIALTATILLVVMPESMTEAGFQLSFAATTALVAGYRWLDRGAMQDRLPRWLLPVYTLFLSSLIAGLATAPFSAAQFNRFSDYGLLANMLTVPVMSVLMAAGVAAALLAPLGLAGPALWIMGIAAEWILFVAAEVAGWQGAVTAIAAPHPAVLPLLTLCGLWLLIWPGRARWAALVPGLALVILSPMSPRPDLLVEERGRLIGALYPGGRVLSTARLGQAVARTWLDNDGDLARPAEAARRSGLSGEPGITRLTLAGKRILHLRGRESAGRIAALCAEADLLITDQTVSGDGGPCLLVDRKMLDRTGALAVWIREGEITLIPARGGARLWEGAAPPPGEADPG